VLVRTGCLSIDFYAWTQWLNRPLPADSLGVCRQPQALSWIDATQDERADLTVALPHWGYEFIHTPRNADRQLASYMTERGVDVIAGHHSHVIQPAEILGSAACFYSLGGLVQGRAAALRWPVRLGAILAIDVSLNLSKQNPRRQWGYEVIPIVHDQGCDAHRLSLLKNASTRMRERMRQRFREVYPNA